MEHRYLKAALTLSVALLALFYFAHNLANWAAATGAVGYVLGLQDHQAYPVSLAPSISSTATHAAVTAIICAGELAAGLTALIGAWRLWSARKADRAGFAAAKTMAVIGAGTAALVWFLLFAVFGGAFYQMWQTEAGANSLQGAWQFSGLALLTLIYVSQPEPEGTAPSDGGA